ncbi:MAG TPA: agmatine deiminase [Spirochaetota bacterium]|nr:agmatine deiminase [Spirochaetota bacterium]
MIPKELNFKMPPEWHKKQRTFLSWPARKEIWISGIEEAELAYANVANLISEFEAVTMIAFGDEIKKAKKLLNSQIEILEIEHDDSWIRDNGPTFVINDKNDIAGINWIFNAWGNKYKNYQNDNKVSEKILNYYGIKIFNAPIVMEGGSFHVDGEGTLITNEECLLNKNRNPNLSKIDIENYLKDYLGVEKIIWLKKGLFGDETDGHIDNFCCFTKPGEMVLQSCYDKNDPNYKIFMENFDILKKSTDAKGRKFTIHIIEQPDLYKFQGKRLTLSYINYYLVNGGLILPTFGGKKNDDDIIAIFKSIFPDRKIVPIDGLPIVKGGGNVHCITQQMPFVTQKS